MATENSASEIFTVRQSEDNKRIKIEGTSHSLLLLYCLLGELLTHPQDRTISAVNGNNGIEIVIELKT